MSMTHEVVQPPQWARPKGYANGIMARGTTLYVAGQIGWDAAGRFPGPDLAAQVGQSLKNIVAVLEAAGGRIEDLVRLTWYITNVEAYRAQRREVGAAYREVLGRHFPVMSVVQVVALVEPEAMVEIEATAVLPDRAADSAREIVSRP
jgi:enamine deaminase RidA (YjgF/YER057c/UK114 family)